MNFLLFIAFPPFTNVLIFSLSFPTFQAFETIKKSLFVSTRFILSSVYKKGFHSNLWCVFSWPTNYLKLSSTEGSAPSGSGGVVGCGAGCGAA